MHVCGVWSQRERENNSKVCDHRPPHHHEMSLRPGGPARGPPAHQNKHAFHHNKNSKKTAVIKRIAHQGLCARCEEQIEWRKKFRKYKPLKAPSHCNGCQQRAVKRAYHTLCDPCARAANKCAKCAEVHLDDDEEAGAEQDAFRMPTEEELADMSERQRRTAVRRALKGRKAGKAGDGQDEEDSDSMMDEDDL
jgi:hypothetical protein